MEYKKARMLQKPLTLLSSVQMQLVPMPLKTGLQPLQVWMLSTIWWIYGDNNAVDLGASCKGVSQDEMESLPCVPSKYASCIAVVDLLGCILIVWVLFSMICVWAGGAPALQLLHCVIAVAEYVRCSKQCISYILVREQCDCENGLLVLDDLVMVLSVV
ncbi:uncharacterized protein MONOS_14722 [Monocercomonoides exilis]|uniref:uncharacterized protein n=1 Tax=Monocercomonoides exilis TaxID=2049356 RepID=UPI003559D000|nr:hypothetical protein MONOS_14722 [Monocercomonoides exilis]|eukprot:MONOS_14722.1-p1 / transcript=MONOS_14722.1 / gene=MONOS_14722 / organism=Monocercomonoides_exilis_PA203 / gene_product=unspecified product / transcript_product=unspecified product / location=Mono_scaffold01059:3906-4832(-) / protein_length=159 / sequence_SO=supercontig / SO=protein_coding / is_pseudo=false